MLYKPNNTILLERINDYRSLKKKPRYKIIPYRFNYPKYKNSSFYSIENAKDNSNISNNNIKKIENYFKQKNNSLCELKKFGKYSNLPNFKVHKNNSVDFLYENERYKVISNKIENHENIDKRLYVKIPHFNYSCSLDKNNIFCLKYDKPKLNAKKKTIKMINLLNNIKAKNEYKIPRMIRILEKNDKIYDEVFSQPWKYRELFEN